MRGCEVQAERAVTGFGGFEAMRRALCSGAGQRLADRDRQLQTVLSVKAGQWHLLGLQAGLFRTSVARGDSGRDRDPQPSLLEAEQLHEAALEDDLIARFEVADVRGVQAVGVRLEHHRCVALLERRLVLPFGFALGHDRTFLSLAVQLRCEAKQHGLEGERKRVDDFQHPIARVPVGLTQRQPE